MHSPLHTTHPVLADIHEALSGGSSVSVATLVERHGSAPRPVGAMMSIHEDGSVVGSISGGCVEAALYENALDALSSGTARVETYGPEGDLITPGLTCGGALSVFIERLTPADLPGVTRVVDLLDDDTAAALHTHTTADGHTTHRVHVESPDAPSTPGIMPDGTVVRVFSPAPRMIIVGSTDFAAETATVGARMGYRVTVCDARPIFATPQRLPDAHEVVVQWPSDYIAAERDSGRIDRRAAIIVLTHDPKIDVPVLVECLDSSRWTRLPAYVGAMGSMTADRRRRADLTAAGIGADDLARLSSPIGLDIGNRGPAETAISIAAELISRRRT